jgi:hypothetical protein
MMAVDAAITHVGHAAPDSELLREALKCCVRTQPRDAVVDTPRS